MTTWAPPSPIDKIANDPVDPDPPTWNDLYPGWTPTQIHEYLTQPKKENTTMIHADTTKIRNVVVDFLDDYGMCNETINELIEQVNDKADPMPQWQKQREERSVTVELRVIVQFDNVLVDDDMDEEELLDAAMESAGVSYVDDVVDVSYGDALDVSMYSTEIA